MTPAEQWKLDDTLLRGLHAPKIQGTAVALACPGRGIGQEAACPMTNEALASEGSSKSMEPALNPRREPARIPWMLGFCFFAVISLILLWEEHRAHILGVLPYVLVLACPIIHIFMHRRQASPRPLRWRRSGRTQPG
jgi:hypothetical protein